MKIEIGEWNRFWEHLGKNWYMDDRDMSPEDDTTLKPGECISITGGVLLWQGDGGFKPVPSIVSNGDGVDLLGAFRKWRKLQNTATIAVEIPKDKVDQLADLLKAIGGRIVK